MGSVMTRRTCLVGVAAAAMAAPARGQQRREVSIGLASTSFATAAARIAKELGLYEAHGLEPKFVVLDNASAATAALISRSVESALSGPGELVVAQARGQKVVVVANTYAGMSGSLVLSKSVAEKLGTSPAAPVGARLKALDGLLIGSTSATGVYTVSFKTAAAAAGAAVRFTYMAQPAMQAALESGAIQGFVGGAPFWAFPITKGSGVLWISGPRGELPSDHVPASSSNLQVMRAFADEHPDVVQRLAKVFNDLSRTLEQDPERVKSAVFKLYPSLDATALDLLFSVESQAWKVRPVTAKDMAREVAYVKLIGSVPAVIDSIDPASMLAQQ